MRRFFTTGSTRLGFANSFRKLARKILPPSRASYADGLQKLVDFINFKFHENASLAKQTLLAQISGGTVRRLLKYDRMTINIESDHLVAADSLDHIHPWGTKRDNSTNLNFNIKLIKWLGLENIRLLDIGCSGGGFVKTMHDAGALAIGLEGSDYSKIRARAEWATIPDRLFTADATKPFKFSSCLESGKSVPVKFSVITAWEFLEHIEETDLPTVFDNIDKNLDCNGVVIMSVSTVDDYIEGVNLHRTVKPYPWWLEKINHLGFKHHEKFVPYFAPDNWIRYEENAAGSFHLVMTRINEEPNALPDVRAES